MAHSDSRLLLLTIVAASSYSGTASHHAFPFPGPTVQVTFVRPKCLKGIPLIDVTVSYSSSESAPLPRSSRLHVRKQQPIDAIRPSALFFNSCLVSSLMLYSEVVRSYPRRGRALASTTPFHAFSPSSPHSCLPIGRARFTASISGLSRSPSTCPTASVSLLPSLPSRYPGHLRFIPPLRALSGTGGGRQPGSLHRSVQP